MKALKDKNFVGCIFLILTLKNVTLSELPLRIGLEEYIEYYNNERISLELKGMSPAQYRAHSQTI